jgi:ribonuclease HI
MLLKLMKSHLLVGMPRKVTFGNPEVVQIFTDGSLEGDDSSGMVAGIGAVLVDESGRCVKAFSYIPRTSDVELIGGKIHQLEILPVVMGCIAFSDDIKSKCIFIHVDNTAAQSS